MKISSELVRVFITLLLFVNIENQNLYVRVFITLLLFVNIENQNLYKLHSPAVKSLCFSWILIVFIPVYAKTIFIP